MSRKTSKRGRVYVFTMVAVQLGAFGCGEFSSDPDAASDAAQATSDAPQDTSTGPSDSSAGDAAKDAKPPPDGSPDAPFDAKQDVNILDGGSDADATLDAPKDGPSDAPFDTGTDAAAEAGVVDAGPDAAIVIPQLAFKAVELISVSTSGAQANADCDSVRASDDKRFVTFFSAASNLVVGDTNASSDVFIRDRALSTTKLVSLAQSGVANGGSHGGFITGSGTHVVFVSSASNLVAGDTNGKDDGFIFNVASAAMERVTIPSGGGEANNNSDVMVVSDDGRFVAFESDATNLVTGDTNGATDIFLRDRTQNTTIRVSVGAGGVQANGLSRRPHMTGDGRFVVYESDATNLVTGDTNGVRDTFAYTVATQATLRLSETAQAVQGNGLSDRVTMSSTGLFSVFRSAATNLVAGDTNNLIDFFRVSNSTPREVVRLGSSQASFATARATISTNGNVVVTETTDSFLKSADQNGVSDIYIWDLTAAPVTQTLVSTASNGNAGNGASIGPFITSDGTHVVYRSAATNLNGITDTNGFADVFLSRILQ